MQHKDNTEAEADVVFLRNQIRLAQELTKRNIEFAIIPLVSCKEKDAKVHMSVSKSLQEAFLRCK